MLKRLSIQNYAIIDELQIDFSGRLNVITGETGAGKSIIVGALGLILGERADTGVLLNHDRKCVVEGFFSAENKPAIMQFLKENDLDAEDELVLRREIGTNAKSRGFINDTPVNLDQLQKVSAMLVDLHQQFDSFAVGESGFQREVLDALASNQGLLGDYQKQYQHWQLLKKELQALEMRKQQFDKESDYNQFLFSELDEAAFRENELEELEAELKVFNNAEGIKGALAKIYMSLQENEVPIVNELKMLSNQLHAYTAFHPDLPVLLQRLQSTQIELQDIADEVDRISSHVNYDPEKVEQINERVSMGYKLQKKHGVRSTNDLLDIRKLLEDKLQAVLNIDETIKQKEKETELLNQQSLRLALILREGRSRATKPLEESVNKLLKQVGMPNARLKVDIKATELNSYGGDSIEFLFDANNSNQFLPVRKVASGGELSRLMLCIKSLVAESVDLPTLIFDEIDTGISGEAARQVGIIMKDLAAKRQLICITHQPQIAGKADAHFFVYKEIKNSGQAGEPVAKVKTNIRLLTQEERITTIAKMLSGEKPTSAALENAREMLMC